MKTIFGQTVKKIDESFLRIRLDLVDRRTDAQCFTKMKYHNDRGKIFRSFLVPKLSHIVNKLISRIFIFAFQLNFAINYFFIDLHSVYRVFNIGGDLLSQFVLACGISQHKIAFETKFVNNIHTR